MKLFYAFLIMTLTVNAMGQADLKTVSNITEQANNLDLFLRSLTFNNASNYSDIAGSPYLKEEFADGYVILETGQKIDLSMRYNIYNDLMEFKNKGVTYNFNEPEKVKLVAIGEHRFEYVEVEQGQKSVHMYLELLADGKLKLYKHHRIKILDARKAETHRPATPPQFTELPGLLMINDQETGKTETLTNRKEFIGFLIDKNEKIRSYVEKNKVSITNEKSVIDLVNFYNSLEN